MVLKLHSLPVENLPNTRRQALLSGSGLYFTGRPCKHGHVSARYSSGSICVECMRTPEYLEKARNHGAKLRSTAEGSALINSRSARWRKTPSGSYSMRRSRRLRRHRARLATPKWANIAAMRDFIDSCPDGFHLDHIIPLFGEDVCGLHILENLQFLPAQENIRKSNKVIPITLEYAVCPITTSGTME